MLLLLFLAGFRGRSNLVYLVWFGLFQPSLVDCSPSSYSVFSLVTVLIHRLFYLMESYFQSGRLLMMAAMIFMAEIPPVVQLCSETNQLDFKQFKNVARTRYYLSYSHTWWFCSKQVSVFTACKNEQIQKYCPLRA